jgi:hypothetical protein
MRPARAESASRLVPFAKAPRRASRSRLAGSTQRRSGTSAKAPSAETSASARRSRATAASTASNAPSLGYSGNSSNARARSEGCVTTRSTAVASVRTSSTASCRVRRRAAVCRNSRRTSTVVDQPTTRLTQRMLRSRRIRQHGAVKEDHRGCRSCASSSSRRRSCGRSGTGTGSAARNASMARRRRSASEGIRSIASRITWATDTCRAFASTSRSLTGLFEMANLAR